MPRTLQVSLPCGLSRTQGVVVRDAVIKKMKGRVQKDISELSAAKNPNVSEIYNALLQACVESVGEKPGTSLLFEQLTFGDRDWLLFEAVKLMKGETPRYTVKCDRHDVEIDVEGFDLSDLPVTGIADEAALWLNVASGEALTVAEWEVQGGVPEKTVRVFCLENADLGTRALFTYPKGMHQKRLNRITEDNVKVIWTLMSSTCMHWKDEERDVRAPNGGFKPDFWGDVDLDALQWAQAAFADALPGMDTDITVECPEGHEFNVKVSATDFLFSAQTQTS